MLPENPLTNLFRKRTSFLEHLRIWWIKIWWICLWPYFQPLTKSRTNEALLILNDLKFNTKFVLVLLRHHLVVTFPGLEERKNRCFRSYFKKDREGSIYVSSALRFSLLTTILPFAQHANTTWMNCPRELATLSRAILRGDFSLRFHAF